MMRKLSLLVVLSVSAGALVVACSSSSSEDTSPGSDASVDGTTSEDAGAEAASFADASDSGAPVDASVAVASFAIVHAAPDLGDLYDCTKVSGGFAAGQLPAFIPALAGAHIALSAGDSLGLAAFESQDILIKAVDVPLGADGGLPTCSAILNGSAGVPASSIFQLTPVPAGTFKPSHSYLFTILGCAAGDDAGVYSCGSDYKGAKTVREEIVELDETTNPGNAIGAQFLDLSPQMAALAPSVISRVSVPTGGDGGVTTTLIGKDTTFAPHSIVPTPVKAVPVPNATTDVTKTVFSVLIGNGDGGVGAAFDPPFDLTFSDIVLATTGDPATVPSYFATGGNYTFILLGDPLVAAAPGNAGARVIAIPNK